MSGAAQPVANGSTPTADADRAWPVPGRFMINRSDKSDLEGEGEFGTVRSGGRTHTGIDIQGNIGDPIVSYAPGTVVYAGNSLDPNGFGNTVIVDHGNGLATVYAHLDSIGVSEGQQVGADTQLGTLGKDGNVRSLVDSGAGDPHLHFETIEGFDRPNLNSGQAVDPQKYLNGLDRDVSQRPQPATPGNDNPTPTQSTASVPAPAAGDYREGDRGEGVRQLQERLNQNGANLDVDGEFGPLTRAAVEQYQRANGLEVDGIAGVNTLGALNGSQQSGPPNASPEAPANGNPGSIANSSDFGAQLRSDNLKDSSIYLAIGLAEGTIDRNGNPTEAYFGHTDPGNGVTNRGFGSYQVHQHPKGSALTAEEADRVQADRLAGEWNRIDQALTQAGFQPGPTRDLIAANALDGWNQTPATLGGNYGLLNPDRLSELKTQIDAGASPQSAITEWRSQSYREDDGRLNAPGLGGTIEGVRADQARRVAAVADGLELRPTQQQSATQETTTQSNTAAAATQGVPPSLVGSSAEPSAPATAAQTTAQQGAASAIVADASMAPSTHGSPSQTNASVQQGASDAIADMPSATNATAAPSATNETAQPSAPSMPSPEPLWGDMPMFGVGDNAQGRVGNAFLPSQGGTPMPPDPTMSTNGNGAFSLPMFTNEGGKAQSPAMPLTDGDHPDNKMLIQAIMATEKLPPGTFGSPQEQLNIAAAITQDAKLSGLNQIDHVMMGTKGGILAIEGDLMSDTHRKAFVDLAHAKGMNVETVSQALAEFNNKQSAHDQGPTMTAAEQAQPEPDAHKRNGSAHVH